MKGTLRKEVRPITFDKIIIELEAPERDTLLRILDMDIKGNLAKGDEAVSSKFKASLREPELVTEPAPVERKKAEVPKMKTDDIDPTDPKFKSKILGRLMETYLMPNVKNVEQWKTSSINFVLQNKKEVMVRPKSMKDDDFFDWLVEANFIDKTGSPVDQTKVVKPGPVKK